MDPVLWRPSGVRTRLDEFTDQVREGGGPVFDSYEDLWQWSVDDLEAFWSSVWTYVDVPSDGDPSTALADEVAMPGAEWFPDVRLNYAEAMLRMPGRADDDVVVIARSQSRDEIRMTAAELRDQVARARLGLVRFGVGPGDRVAAYAPNIPETLVLMLATASLGAVFSSCAPEFGVQSVIDRWQQIEPKLLLAVDGYRYGDKAVNRRAEVEAIRARLQSVHTVVWLPYLDDHAIYTDGAKTWADLVSEPGPLEFERVPFATPLYVLFSSGTTGLPKPIVHGHGGITIEHLKVLSLQSDLGPTDRFFWYSTTGWMMWNYLVSGIGVGATIVLFDGNPAQSGPVDALAPGRRARAHLLRHVGAVPAAVPQGGARAARHRRPVAPARRRDRPALPCRPRGSDGSTRPSATHCSSRRSRAAPTSARRSSAQPPRCPCTPARSPAAASAARSRRSTSPATRSSTSWASSSSPGRCRRCRSGSGVTPTGPATARRTSRTSPACGATATGSPSPSAAPAWSPAAVTRR